MIGMILLFTTAAVAVFFIVPQWDAIAMTRGEIQRLQLLSQELTDLASQRDTLTKEYNAISEADLQKLKSIAPSGPDAGTALVDFESLAGKSNLVLGQADFAGNSPASPGLVLSNTPSVVSVPVTLALRGSYEAFRSFLRDLEHNVRLVDVTDISFGAEGTGAAGPAAGLGVNVKGKIYYRP